MSGKAMSSMLHEGNVRERPISPKEYFKQQEPYALAVNNSHLLSVHRPALPIIFVPGIMASRLYNPELKVSAWDPDAAFALAKQYVGETPQRRFEILAKDKDALQVMNKDIPGVTTHCWDTFKDHPYAVKRGWGGVMWGAYGDLITELDTWDSPLKFLVDLPVYAFGYNWMLSNSVTGDGLKSFINTIKEVHKASHVVLVTHSMGGLVARAACGIHNIASDVFGVIHGAQPSLGAVDAYRRMVAGETGVGIKGTIAAKTIGPGGKEITAVLANTVAGLELLPTKHYHLDPAGNAADAKEKKWLHMLVAHEGKEPRLSLSLPDSDDPYDTIYLKKDVYWKLLHEEWIIATGGDPTADIRANIVKARDFHDELEKDIPYVHPMTVQLYSSGKLSTFCEVVWLTEEITSEMKKFCTGESPGELEEWFENHLKASHKVGTFREVLLVAKGEDPEKTGAYQGVITPFSFSEEGEITGHLARGGSVYLRRLLERGESVAGLPANHSGDSTVPENSGQGLAPAVDLWPIGCKSFFLGMSAGKKHATFRPNAVSHQDFYDNAAIKAVKNTLNNMVLAWVETFGDKAGKPFNCKMECIKNPSEGTQRRRS